MIRHKVTGIVLAGGKSSRMGTDKAHLIFRGKPLIMHAVDILRQVCEHIVISSNRTDYAFTGCETWPDELPLHAPMIGIYSCLKRSDNDLNIVLTCDMPLLYPGLFDVLLSHSKHHDIVLPVHHEGSIEPLCGVYNRKVLLALGEEIRHQQYGLQFFVKKYGFWPVESGPGMSFYRTNMFVNINTANDFDLLSNS